MEKDELEFTRITSKDLKKVEHHLYKIRTTKGIFHISHMEAGSLYIQLKTYFEDNNVKETNCTPNKTQDPTIH